MENRYDRSQKTMWLGIGTAVLGGLLARQMARRQPSAAPRRFAEAAFVLEPFQPATLLSNRHVQTILAYRWRPTAGVSFRRVRRDTPDGDFVDLDFADVVKRPWSQLADEAPIVLVLHGLEGSARRPYACELYRQLAARGIRALGLNFRSCSGEDNRLARTYHAGETTDVAWVVDWLNQQYPQVIKGLVGFSLGANVLLKYLGEQGAALPASVQAAVAVSPPFDMVAGAKVLDSGSGRLYMRYLLWEVQQKVQRRTAVLPDTVDLARALAAKTIHEFDNACTAPLNGFRNAQDYYERCSSAQFLPGIQVPTLLLRALDDPFFAADVPERLIAANPYLHPGFTTHGGHVAFVEGRLGRLTYWAERQAARFLAGQLHTAKVNRG